LNAKQISNALDIPVRLVRQILQELGEVDLVVEIAKGIKGEIAFQPGRTIENITVKSALDEHEKHDIVKIPANKSEEAQKSPRF
jgi:DNA-binding IscR family transcriptional regulator